MMKKGRLIALTGAGISAESGLRTFRDSNGLWEEHRVEDALKLLSTIVGSTTIDDEGHLDALGLLARCHIVLRQTERAISVLDVIVETVNLDKNFFYQFFTSKPMIIDTDVVTSTSVQVS